MPDPQLFRPEPPGTSLPRPSGLLLALLLALALCPASTWGEEGEAPFRTAQAEGAGEERAAGDEEVEAPSGEAEVAPPSDVEVIRVKGRAVAAIETEVPASVTQFDAAAIEALGARDISDLARITPNLEIKTAGATAPTFFIRGVGLSDFNANAAGAVSVYQDDVALNAPAIQLGQLFDVESVEVLRGPQGGGSGRNASAGAIKVHSRRPTGELAADLRSTLGNLNLRDFEGALEAPLVEEALATRLAFRFTQRDPYGGNGCTGAPPQEERFSPLLKGVWIPRRPEYMEGWCGEDLTGAPNPDPPPTDIRTSFLGLEPKPVVPGRPWDDPEKIDQFFEDFFSARNVSLPGEVNDIGTWAARGQLRFQPPGTEMDWLLNAHGGRLDQLSTLGQAIGTRQNFFGGPTDSGYRDPDILEMEIALVERWGNQALARKALARELGRNLDMRPYRGDYNRVGQTRLDTLGGFLRGDWSIGPVEFTSISGYDAYERFREQDLDFTPAVLFENVVADEAWQASQELRLAGELAEHPFRWEAGGYYLMEELSSKTEWYLAQESQNNVQLYDQNLWSFAVYGGFSWDFLDDFTLEGGVRYNWERKDFDFNVLRFGGTVGNRTQDSRTWWAPTGTLSLSYRFGEDASIYWKYSRGWKGGHFNASASTAKAAVPAEPEVIDAFETGLRGRWLDGRLALGASLFYYKYVDYQVFLVEDIVGSPPQIQILNANDAEVYGGELDFRAEPLAGWVPGPFDGLVLTGRFGWLESQFLDFTNEVVRLVGAVAPKPFTVTIDYSGNQLINSPRFKASLAAEWTLDLGRWGTVVPRYDFAWSDDIFFDPSEGRGSPNFRGQSFLPEYAVGQRAFWLHNARLAYRTPDGNIEISGWVRNLTDQAYKTYAFDASVFADVVVNFVGEPRTFGGSITITW